MEKEKQNPDGVSQTFFDRLRMVSLCWETVAKKIGHRGQNGGIFFGRRKKGMESRGF